MMSQTDETNQK